MGDSLGLKDVHTPTVFLRSTANSTTFTTCCEVAIWDQANCPKCGLEIMPRSVRGTLGNSVWPTAPCPGNKKGLSIKILIFLSMICKSSHMSSV